MSKYYYANQGFRHSLVYVGVDDVIGVGGPRLPIGQLTQHTRHSPDGHAWGYGGSGPSQLALDILWDLYGQEPERSVYQGFKSDVLANLDSNSGFELTEDEIRGWVRAHGGFVAAGG